MRTMHRACLIAVTVAGVAAAAPAVANAAAQDKVSGQGSIPIIGTSNDVRVNAHSGASGEKPGGTFTLNFGGSRYQVKVSCLVVVDSTAVVGGLDQSGTEKFVIVHDNGNGNNSDQANYAFGLPSAPEPDQARCTAILASNPPLFPVTGDFIVVNG
jgi:hypothetical protein